MTDRKDDQKKPSLAQGVRDLTEKAFKIAGITQMVECLFCTQNVTGSIPVSGSKFKLWMIKSNTRSKN